MILPDRSSIAARQTTSGCSPSLPTNSKSRAQSSANGRSLGITGGPFSEQRMLLTVDQPAAVLAGESNEPRRFEIGPVRCLRETFRRRLEHLIDVVLQIGVEPHPLVDPRD